jgi:hypothetical protein
MIDPGISPWLLVLLTFYPGFKMGNGHLRRPWLTLLLCLWGVLALNFLSPGPSAWAGLSALWAVFGAWYYLQCWYAGQSGVPGLWGCSAVTILTLAFSVATGVALWLALIGFSGLHCFLHEREERAVGAGSVSRRVVFSRWMRSWGVAWALPTLIGFLALRLFLVGWGSGDFLWECNVSSGTQAPLPWGYFSSFHQEFTGLWQPADGSEARESLLVSAGFKSLGLLLIGLVPILGILGGGYHIPGRFVYRLLQRPDEELLLFWLCALGLIIATGGYSTSSAIVGHGFLAFLLAFWVCALRYAKRGPLRWLG